MPEEVGNLVVSRRKGEVIEIGEGITITVVEVRADKVRLMITAPKSVSVHRAEVAEAIRKEKASA